MAVPNLPFYLKSDKLLEIWTTWLPILLQPITGEGAKAWTTFFLNVDLLRQLSEAVPHDTKKAVLDAGVMWDGTGWNTSKASKKLWDMVGVGLVSGDVNQYKDAFIN